LPPEGKTERAIDNGWTPIARLGVWFQPPRRVISGKSAKIRWWHRLRSLILLGVFVIFGGIFMASLIGLIIFAGGFLLEQAIG
tara:strand:+ start:48947 stop:49195 length:249 start_codon:yes stop_codon:yes gene_type:complete